MSPRVIAAALGIAFIVAATFAEVTTAKYSSETRSARSVMRIG
jgi:uncharacterized protein involved in exopolysaccharide biosynthesis